MKVLPFQEYRHYTIRYGLDAGLVLIVRRRYIGGIGENLGRPEGFPPIPVMLTMKWKHYFNGIPETINYQDNSRPRKISRRYTGPSTISYRLLNYKNLGKPVTADFHRWIYDGVVSLPITYTREKLLTDFNIHTRPGPPWFETPVDQMAWLNLLDQDS